MTPTTHRLSLPALLLSCLAACGPTGPSGAAAPVRRAPATRRPATRPAPAKPPAKPGTPPASTSVTAASLGPMLKAAGYTTVSEAGYQRVRVEEDTYGYFIDFSISKSGDWLVCMAHLAPIPDLTKVPAAPLVSLLAANDSLLGMYFSYGRVDGQVMLNATVPNRGLNPTAIKSLVEGMKATIRDTHGLWDPSAW